MAAKWERNLSEFILKFNGRIWQLSESQLRWLLQCYLQERDGLIATGRHGKRFRKLNQCIWLIRRRLRFISEPTVHVDEDPRRSWIREHTGYQPRARMSA